MLEDFEQQFDRSIALIQESRERTLFDRCPIDFLAYALALEEPLDLDAWIERMQGAIALLDLIVFLPIEKRIPVPDSEDRKLRRDVDERLHEIILEDSFGILDALEVIEASGSLENRVRKILECVTIIP